MPSRTALAALGMAVAGLLAGAATAAVSIGHGRSAPAAPTGPVTVLRPDQARVEGIATPPTSSARSARCSRCR